MKFKNYNSKDYEAVCDFLIELNRAKNLGARKAYVLSDMPFYEKLGFKKDKHFTFLWKK